MVHFVCSSQVVCPLLLRVHLKLKSVVRTIKMVRALCPTCQLHRVITTSLSSLTTAIFLGAPSLQKLLV